MGDVGATASDNKGGCGAKPLYKVQDLLSLKEGQVFESLSSDTEDVPLMIGKVQLGWSEFEILEQRMALRLTRVG